VSEFSQGLNAQQVFEARTKFGSNAIESSKSNGLFARIFNVIKEPMLLLLLAAALVSLVLADPLDAGVLMFMVLAVIAITVIQEGRAEKALDALKSLSAPHTTVIRDGKEQLLPSAELVVGDLVKLQEGDRIPADMRCLEAVNAIVDESALTGESLPVEKQTKDELSSGSLLVSGRILAVIIAVGTKTELGKIGSSLAQESDARTRLQRDVNRLVKVVAVVAASAAVLLALTLFLTRGNLLDALLAGIASAMAMIPEELPVVLTLFFAIGAWKMTREKVVVRKSAAIETLGSVTTICVDKTGTLTLNQLSVDQLIPSGEHAELADYAAHAAPGQSADAVDQAFHSILDERLGELVHEYPISPEFPAMTLVWDTGSEYFVATKGAPEAVASISGVGQDQIAELTHNASQGGRRILAVAGVRMPKGPLPKSQQEFRLEFQGLVALRDTLRPGVKDAIAQCHDAGIRVVMITGDFIGTAREIASEVGLKDLGELTGTELDELSDVELRERVKHLSVCARMTPSHKLRLVQALQATNEVVAMTGDGVNDAPALRLADISIAMGLRGTDVAKEASKLIITDDDFSSIVAGVRRGKGIYDGIRKSVTYIISVHVPLLGVALLPIFWPYWPIVLLPAMVAFLEIIIDPACTIVFQSEPIDPKIMKRKPRPVDQSLFDFKTLGIALIQGAAVLIVVLVQYFWLLQQGRAEEEIRSASLILMVLSNLLLIFVNRSWELSAIATLIQRRNPSALWISVLALSLLALLTLVQPVSQSFRLGPTSSTDWLVAIGLALVSVSWFEVYKKLTKSQAR